MMSKSHKTKMKARKAIGAERVLTNENVALAQGIKNKTLDVTM